LRTTIALDSYEFNLERFTLTTVLLDYLFGKLAALVLEINFICIEAPLQPKSLYVKRRQTPDDFKWGLGLKIIPS
jgi:hypothetical protein